MRKSLIWWLVLILFFISTDGGCGKSPTPKREKAKFVQPAAKEVKAKKKEDNRFVPKKEEVKPLKVGKGERVLWKLETSKGEVIILLFPDKAPLNCGNIVYLTEHSFYDNTIFHRYVPGFVIQGGDPTGTGRGGPGYELEDEISDEPFIKGTVGIANRGPNTNGSQFFICLEDAHHLDGKYTVIGRVIKGMDVVEQLRVGDRLIKAEVIFEKEGEAAKKGENGEEKGEH